MPFTNQEVFQLTKIIYKEIYQNFTQNYIGEKEPLQQFQQNYIQPLYPVKRIQQDQPPDQSIKQKISQYRHKYDQQIIQFSQSAAESAQTQQDQSQVSYVSAIQRYSLGDLICRLRLGRFFCWKSTPPDHVYEDLGLGICLYLKFMKHLVIVLLLLTILSAIVMSIFYGVAQSNKYHPTLNYQKALFSLGVGSLSLEGIKCIHQNVTNTAIQFDLVCPVGFVRVLGPVYTSSMFQTLQTCKQDILSFKEQIPTLYMNGSQYISQTNCNEHVQNCTYNLTVASPNTNYQQISVTYQCIDGKSVYGTTAVSRPAAIYVAVVFDLIMIVSLMLFYWSESSAQKRQEKYFKQKQILLNAFTLQIGSFSKRNFDQEFKDFIEDLQQNIKKQNNIQLNLRKCIIQVRLPDNEQYDQHQKKRQNIYRKMYQFIGQYFIQKEIDPFKYIDQEDFKKSIFTSQSSFKSYRRKLGQLIKDYRKFQKLRGKNRDQQLKIYVVFLKPKYKRLILQKTRIILGKQILQTSRKDYQIIDPPAPSLILWNNIGKNKLLRGIISWGISLLILIGTYILTAYILNLQNNTVIGQYDFNIQCQNVFPDENYNQFNQQQYDQYKYSYTHCYCLTRSIIFSLNFQPVCNQWRDQYSLFLAIPVLYGFGLFVLNEFVSSIYKKLSEFQAHEYLTSELYSFIIKKTILETTDLALIIVLLSIDFNKKSTTFDFLLIGSYDDVSADWHLEVGIVIIVNMFFNIFSPFVEGIFYIGESIMRKLKLCFFHRKSIYNKTKMSYVQNYREEVFPVEQRYASILAILFICLGLNFAYPIMTVIMAVSILLYQLMDKLMIIKAYQKPLNFQGLLQKKIMKVFLVALFLHLIISAVFLTQPFLVVAGHPSNSASIMDQHNTRIQSMFRVGYVLPYMILLVVIVLFVVIIYASDRYYQTKPNTRVRLGLGGIPFEENKFYNLLEAYELDRTIALKRRQIQRNKILQKLYMKKVQQGEQIRQSHTNKPMIPTRKKDLVLNRNKSILSQISQYSYYRLLKRKIKTSKDQQKLIKLAGMTTYEWQKDWIYFDQQVRLDYKVPDIDSYLNKIAQQSDYRKNLIHHIIEIARMKNRMQGKKQKEIQKDQDIKEQKVFEQIINQSHITSVDQEQNFLQIQNTQLPILQLQKQISQMHRMQTKQKSVQQNSIRGSSRQIILKSRQTLNLNANINQAQKKQQSDNRSQQNNNNNNRLPILANRISQQKEQQNNIHLNPHEIKLKIRRENSTSYNNNRLSVSASASSNNKQMKRQYIQQTQFNLAPIQQVIPINLIDDPQHNSQEEQDQENEIQIQPEDNVADGGETTLIIAAEQQHKQNRQQNHESQGNVNLNQLPSEKILLE